MPGRAADGYDVEAGVLVEPMVLDGHDGAKVEVGQLTRAHVALARSCGRDRLLDRAVRDRLPIETIAAYGHDGGGDRACDEKDEKDAAHGPHDGSHGLTPPFAGPIVRCAGAM